MLADENLTEYLSSAVSEEARGRAQVRVLEKTV